MTVKPVTPFILGWVIVHYRLSKAFQLLILPITGKSSVHNNPLTHHVTFYTLSLWDAMATTTTTEQFSSVLALQFFWLEFSVYLCFQ
jgi:hypothetical protein